MDTVTRTRTKVKTAIIVLGVAALAAAGAYRIWQTYTQPSLSVAAGPNAPFLTASPMVDQLVGKFTVTNNSTATSTTLASVSLNFSGTNLTSKTLNIYVSNNQGGMDLAHTSTINIPTTGPVASALTPSVVLAPGSSRTFEVKLDTTSAAEGDTLLTKLNAGGITSGVPARRLTVGAISFPLTSQTGVKPFTVAVASDAPVGPATPGADQVIGKFTVTNNSTTSTTHYVTGLHLNISGPVLQSRTLGVYAGDSLVASKTINTPLPAAQFNQYNSTDPGNPYLDFYPAVPVPVGAPVTFTLKLDTTGASGVLATVLDVASLIQGQAAAITVGYLTF